MRYYNSAELAQQQWDSDTSFTNYDRNITLDHRLTAAVDNECDSMDRLHFVDNLQKAGCALNVDMLTNLALHEPSTFSSLIELAHRYVNSNLLKIYFCLISYSELNTSWYGPQMVSIWPIIACLSCPTTRNKEKK